jgi:hypothetical protein
VKKFPEHLVPIQNRGQEKGVGYVVVLRCGGGLFAVWVFFDAKKRGNNMVGWSLATLVIGPVSLPVYFAKRYLKEGESREGGTAWNVLKTFALYWTILMIVVGISGMVGVSGVAQQATSSAEQAGVVIGATLGLGMIIGLWFFVLVAALVLGLFMKKSSVVEKGPTGPLAQVK